MRVLVALALVLRAVGRGDEAATRFRQAIEINPQVIAACRLWFKLPADNDKLSVILGDAQEVAAHDHWRHRIDHLHVDLYDHQAAAPVLDSPEFYADCRNLLTDIGVMAVNLFGRSHQFDRSQSHIVQAFQGGGVWTFKPTREGNTVVLAARNPREHSRATWLAQAEEIERLWPALPATRWVKALSSVS